MHPGGKVLYALNDGDNSISQYYLAHDGCLKPRFPPTVPTDAGPEFMSFDPGGRHAYVVNHDAESISQYTVKSDGCLVPLAASYSLKGNAPKAVIVDGRFAFVLTSDGVLTLHVDPDGKLGSELAPATSTLQFPDAMALAPSGRFLYLISGSGDLYQYSVSAAGQLTPLLRQDAQISGGTVAICITPDGRFVYAANNALGNVIQYMVRSDGSLELLWPQTTPIGKYANGITVVWRGGPAK
jgi:6-phosphogluconolactonase (cycloisomerase 2 family)